MKDVYYNILLWLKSKWRILWLLTYLRLYFFIKEKNQPKSTILLNKSSISVILEIINFLTFAIFELFNPIFITILLVVEIPILLFVIPYKDLDY